LAQGGEKIFGVGDTGESNASLVLVKIKEDGLGHHKTKDLGVVGRIFFPLYEDIDWACRGLTTKIQNGTSVPMFQLSVLDVGFLNLMNTRTGRDNAFLYHNGDVNVMSNYNEATEFFGHYLYDCPPWSKDNVIPYC